MQAPALRACDPTLHHPSMLPRLLRRRWGAVRTAMTASAAAPAEQAGVAAAAGKKHAVRKRVREALRGMSEEDMQRESAAIAQRVLGLEPFRTAQRLAIYVPCPRLREVDTSPLLAAALERGTRVYVPRVQDKEANMHFLHLDSCAALAPVPPFGILEPPPEYGDGSPREDALEAAAPLDLVVMPGLAFSRDGHRLGRGGGYYDNFIEACNQRAAAQGWAKPLLVALAYSPQLLGTVPLDEHDHPVDLLVTADKVVRCSERGQAVV